MKVEFYLDTTGTFIKKIYLKLDDGDWIAFEDLTPEQIEAIFCKVIEFEKARKGLLHLSTYYPGDKKEILRQFVICNWTKLDKFMDISDRELKFENISCPFKSSGNCPYKGKGIVCIKHKP